MVASRRSDRIAGATAVSMFAAALGFSIGNFGPLGFLVFMAYLPFMAFTAGPGTALIVWGLDAYMEKRALSATSRGELWCVGLLLVLPPAALNAAGALKLMGLLPAEFAPLLASLDPLPILLATGWGALGLVYATLAGLQPGRTP